jgi:hypothetical protein
MGATRDQERSRAAWSLARRQHGVLARRDLLALGFTSKAIRCRIEGGRLRPICRGVYAVGWTPLTPEARWMAAVLACGTGAVLSHRSAAQLWGIGREWEGRIDVSVTRSGKVRRPGIKVRRRPSLRSDSVVYRLGIPVTDPVQTIIDLATELKPLRLERAVNEADKLDLVDLETLRSELDARVGEPGVKTLRTTLGRHTFQLSDSGLEILFRDLIRAAAFPSPCRNTGCWVTRRTSTSPPYPSWSRPTASAITALPPSRLEWRNAIRRTPLRALPYSASRIGRSPTHRAR